MCTLRTASLTLVFSSAEHCAPVWLNSALVDKIDCQLNEEMRIISATLKSTPVASLPVLYNICPPGIRGKLLLFHFEQILVFKFFL